MTYHQIAVAGGGVLGSQIAFQSAFWGYEVTIWLRSSASIDRAKIKLDTLKRTYLTILEEMKTNEKAYVRGISTEKLSENEIEALKKQVEKAYDSLKLTTDYQEAFSNKDLVIECIAENPDEKIAFYQELAKHLDKDTVIATNSSTMLPSTFASYTGRPEKYLALHFANEIWKNNTAEIMGHAQTDSKYVDELIEFASSIHMVPLRLNKEQPGYILNSMLVPFLNAAEALLASGVADVETIDKTWTLGTGAPVGPFRILDVVGLTTAYNIVSNDPRSKDPNTIQGKIAKTLKQYIDEGKLGIQSGEGFYKYK